jgi:nucleoside-diphosphate-sugar epimerase
MGHKETVKLTVMITGGNGFLGSRLVKALRDNGASVISYDHAEHKLLDLRYGDGAERFRGALAMLCADSPTLVVHAAGMPGRLFCERQPAKARVDNFHVTATVVDACVELKAPLVLFSTSEVYGHSCDHGSVDEDAQLRPRNIYGVAKADAEFYARKMLGDKVTIVRPTMPFGPGNLIGEGRAALPTFIANALSGTSSFAHPGTARSWCFIDDLIRGIICVIEKLDGRCFNVGRDDDLIDTYDLARMVYRILGADQDLVQPGEPDETITPIKDISCARLRGLGWAPRVSLHEGICRTADWLREQQRMAA